MTRIVQILMGGVAAGALLPAAAQAQVVADTDDITGADIVVTANKREQRLRDVPMAISAVTGDELNQRRLIDLQDLVSRVPGLSFQRGGNGPSQRVILRGLSTGGGQLSIDGPTVASVVDDVPVSFSSGTSAGASFSADFDPFDLQRVEVLKGPQGTLYGASALGGLIKYVTNTPDPTKVDAGIDAGISALKKADKAGLSLKGFANAPIVTDKAAVRVSGYYDYIPGWIGNRLGNNGQTNKTNALTRYGGRASVLLTPTEPFSLRLTAFVQKLEGDGYDNVDVVGGLANPADPFRLQKGYNLNTYRPQPFDTLSQVYASDAKYELGDVTLQSVTSYVKIRTNFQFDNPGLSSAIGFPWGRANTALVSRSRSSLKKVSQELRISSPDDRAEGGSGLSWQIGGFFTQETTSYVNDYNTVDITTGNLVVTPRATTVLPPGSSRVFLGTLDARYREFAAYADITYHFSESFDIQVGGRVFTNRTRFTNSTGGALFSPPRFQTKGPFFAKETDLTFSVAPRLRLSPTSIVYARVASGYRPGGPNPPVPGPATPLDTPVVPDPQYKSDSTINYEVGYKGTLFDRLLTVELAAFYVDWSDIQVAGTIARNVGTPTQSGFPVAINGGKGESKGVEWNFVLNPLKGLAVGWAGAYTKAELKNPIALINAPAGVQLPYSPKWSHSATIDYTVPIKDDVTASFGAIYSYVGDRATTFSTNRNQSYQAIPSYSTWGLSAGVQFARIGIQVYGKNLDNSRGITTYTNNNVGPFGRFPGQVGLIRPREVGVRLTSRF